jgi:hypothetical protein
VNDTERRRARIGELVTAVARHALAERGLSRLVLLDDGSPEARLAAGLLAPLGEAFLCHAPDAGEMDSLLHAAGRDATDEAAREEAHRFTARLLPDALLASARCKTDLLVGGVLPPESFFPLGDLFAGEVVELAGGWRGSAIARELADELGGVERLDGEIRALLEGREARDDGLAPHDAGARVAAALARGSAARSYPRLVPKLSARTIGVDLFE